MTQQSRQQVFLEVAERNSVLDGPTLTRLLHAVPDPEQAIKYLVEKQLLDEEKADQLRGEYLKASQDIESTEMQPARRVMPSPPPRPGETPAVPARPAANSAEVRQASPQRKQVPRNPQPETSEIDAFDAMIDEILND